MPRNYYVILGIADDASLDEIKAAFRRRAMELHPDTSGLESGPFLELQEAYGVLSDPERRWRYDHQTHPIITRRRPWRPAAEPMVRARPQAEPLRAPARATCPACGGSGAAGFYQCWRCEGHGALTTEYPIPIPYPPGTYDGYAVQIPLNRFGIENLYLTVLFRVSGAW
jgi:DnaJ-class molecular chaperone